MINSVLKKEFILKDIEHLRELLVKYPNYKREWTLNKISELEKEYQEL